MMKNFLMYRCSALLAGFCALSLQAQKETKTFRESFPVAKDVTVEVNTSHSDIQFETWNKNKVEIVATIETEGLSAEEASRYFERWDFRAEGDKSLVKISTHPGNVFVFPGIPEVPDVPKTIEVLPPLPPIPPQMPDMSALSFDYEAYQKDGEAYMEEWKEKIKGTFNEDFKKSMAEWNKEMEKRSKEIQTQAEKIGKEAAKKYANMKVIYLSGENGPEEVRIEGGDSGRKHIKIKKRILIRIPEKAKLKMNVRHGEVKLAENSENIRATLSHASLLAARVDGQETSIETSYAPVLVKNWNGGTLKVNYVDHVNLGNVSRLDLISNTSDVRVGHLSGTGYIRGTFSNLTVDTIGTDFHKLEVILDNTNALIVLPESDFRLLVHGDNSSVKTPRSLKVSSSGDSQKKVIKGYRKKSDSSREITVQARYSELKFQ